MPFGRQPFGRQDHLVDTDIWSTTNNRIIYKIIKQHILQDNHEFQIENLEIIIYHWLLKYSNQFFKLSNKLTIRITDNLVKSIDNLRTI